MLSQICALHVRSQWSTFCADLAVSFFLLFDYVSDSRNCIWLDFWRLIQNLVWSATLRYFLINLSSSYFVIYLQWNLRGTNVQIYDKILILIIVVCVVYDFRILCGMFPMKLRCKLHAKILCYNDNTSLKLYSFCIFRHVRIIILVFKLCIL